MPWGGSCGEGGKVSIHWESPSQVRTGGSFGTSEGSTTNVWETRWKEFGTEISASHHFPAKYLHAHWESAGWVLRLRLLVLDPMGEDWGKLL